MGVLAEGPRDRAAGRRRRRRSRTRRRAGPAPRSSPSCRAREASAHGSPAHHHPGRAATRQATSPGTRQSAIVIRDGDLRDDLSGSPAFRKAPWQSGAPCAPPRCSPLCSALPSPFRSRPPRPRTLPQDSAPRSTERAAEVKPRSDAWEAKVLTADQRAACGARREAAQGRQAVRTTSPSVDPAHGAHPRLRAPVPEPVLQARATASRRPARTSRYGYETPAALVSAWMHSTGHRGEHPEPGTSTGSASPAGVPRTARRTPRRTSSGDLTPLVRSAAACRGGGVRRAARSAPIASR